MGSQTYLEIEVNAEQTFIVHKVVPLLAYCGRLVEAVKEATTKQLQQEYSVSSESEEPGSNIKQLLRLQVTEMPGGPKAFEMVARFCYNGAESIPVISSTNVAVLRCAAEFLDMTESVCKGNLVRKTEEYLRAMVLWCWEESLIVLRSCSEEMIQSTAEKTQLLQRCVNSLAEKACSSFSFAAEMMNSCSPVHAGIESYFASYLVSTPSGTSSHRSSKAASESWWFEDLSTLSVHLMARVVKVMMANRASDHRVLAKFLLHYLRSALPAVLGYVPAIAAATSLASPMPPQHNKNSRDDDEHILHHQTQRAQRQVIEVVVSLLASLERSSVSCRSLLGLRRIAITLRAGKLCRRELERMIGAQLDKASLDNILIPPATSLPARSSSTSSSSSSLYDVELVLRLVDFFLKDKAEALMVISAPVQSALTKVGELMDKYLVEIAADTHLRASRFLALAESLPDYARESDDGLYRAIDIYLEAHPSISESDASRLFKVINYHKLSTETCKAAAHNSRFPPSFIIQVALVQQSQQQQKASTTSTTATSNDISSFRSSGRDSTERSSSSASLSPPSKHSPRAGQQTVVHVQCSHFEFTLRQIQHDKKKSTDDATSSRAAAERRTTSTTTTTTDSSPATLQQHFKKTESQTESFDYAAPSSSCKRSRVEIISSFHRLKQLFYANKSRQQ
ncbi:unnamed protein product [Sphagnum jensenii]|uniref:NPH3 domain-containing protein n=1 Tax=Sphagnum jensenii TaxID=128206 RepID=A0ABP0XNM3_9BRYO